MALHRTAVVVKTRLPNDYTTVLPNASYCRTTVVTDAETGMSVVLVEYVNHTGGYAEWRIQVMVGAAQWLGIGAVNVNMTNGFLTNVSISVSHKIIPIRYPAIP